ncbi:DegT/DnrJ/EryC1/StrS family aminotransferase [Helicobacter anseris]|uniref:DegT/DnrJ/EryC1/StrS family aminotransferase n=1 Tax=Helicobacter anseris TaxID=375926 RepID=A0A3D8J8M6_9HELI|nr:DegT/DnrJ/EryC1/StrS family aminotransferase [Helicobacter anseris]RDU73859.1 DegT/DnrJ/EryC1/StrS family aminotransferase [Helicobacter anseris]
MRYTTAFPHFPQEEIDWILEETRLILNGEKMLSMGENVKKFEQDFAKYCGRLYGIATNSCTSALDTVLRSLNLSESDEVIVPTQTFFANLSSIVNSRAKPIFCDTDENFLMSLDDLKNKITPQTKAVVIVHFSGAISQDIFKIKELCLQHKIKLIEDCAHAHGAYAIDSSGKIFKAGSIGDFACFSFFSTKIITTGEGGMIVCDDEAQALIFRSIANRGLNPLKKVEEFNHYGENFRLSEFNATLGLSQLRCLEDFVTHRNHIAQIYKTELEPLKELLRFQDVAEGYRHSYWRFIVFLKKHKPQEVVKKLAQKGICADAPYSPLLHQQPILAYQALCPKAEELSKTHISLPMHLKITSQDAKVIANHLKTILQEN